MKKICLGVSSCLLGNKVRYDGQHKHNEFICDKLINYVEYVPVCPEVECGLPIPREAMRLVGDPQKPRLITSKTNRDLTEQMLGFVKAKLDELATLQLDGFIFKKGSPSSGLTRVKVYTNKGMPSKTGRGIFAGAFVDRFPLLPVIEEGMLNDLFLKEQFLNRIFSAQRWQESSNLYSPHEHLLKFHTHSKLMLMSMAPSRYRELGQLVENGDVRVYWLKFNQLMLLRPTVKKHANVMQHILGYFKKDIEAWEKQEILESIESYRNELIPISVPLTLLHHHVIKHQKSYLEHQSYWDILGEIYL